jgi:3D (Asp-Asp-Asp) domain-containing protein
MQTPAARVLPIALCLLAAGCATRSLPKYEKPLARAQFQTVRTTAYTHTEGDHLQYNDRNACGDRLQCGVVNSAACDWSRWPVGTVFRVQETGETFVVDDYGWALSGTNTIDLYRPSRAAMNAWGVRRVNLEILQWGDARRSLAILSSRTKYAHVRRMVADLRRRYAELSRPLPAASGGELAAALPEDSASPVEDADFSPRAVAVVPPASAPRAGGFTPSRVPLTPFADAR